MKPQNFITPILVFFSLANCYAQDSTFITIPAGSSIPEILTPAKEFRYPEFRSGQVVFKDGSVAPAKLNYSFLTGEVEFIGPANDTLAISDDKLPLIKAILIDTTVFYYNKEYYEEVISKPGTGRLVKKALFIEMTREKIGAYGMIAPNSSIQTYGSFSNNGNMRSFGNNGNSFRNGLVGNENLILKLAVDYFVENNDNEMLPVNKKNLLKILAPRRKAINEYLDKNKVDFSNEDDLKRLFLAINN